MLYLFTFFLLKFLCPETLTPFHQSALHTRSQQLPNNRDLRIRSIQSHWTKSSFSFKRSFHLDIYHNWEDNLNFHFKLDFNSVNTIYTSSNVYCVLLTVIKAGCTGDYRHFTSGMISTQFQDDFQCSRHTAPELYVTKSHQHNHISAHAGV